MRSALDLLSDSISFFIKHIGILLSIYIVVGVVSVLYGYLIGDPSNIEPTELEPTLKSLGALAIFLIVMVPLNICYYIATIKVISAPETTFNDAYRFSFMMFLPYFIVSFLVGIVIMLGFILFIIPGIIFAIWYSFSVFIVLFENKTGLNAMKQSREYVRGRIGPIFSRFLIVGIIWMIFLVVSNFALGASGMETDSIFAIIANTLISFIVGIIYLIFSYKMYEEVKRTYVPVSAVQNEALQTTSNPVVPSIDQTIVKDT